MKRVSHCLSLLVVAVVLIATIVRAENSNGAAAFEQLSSLVGDWKGEQDGVEISLTYNLTADGSALME